MRATLGLDPGTEAYLLPAQSISELSPRASGSQYFPVFPWISNAGVHTSGKGDGTEKKDYLETGSNEYEIIELNLEEEKALNRRGRPWTRLG